MRGRPLRRDLRHSDQWHTSATAGVQKNETRLPVFCNGTGGAATGGQSYILQGCGTPTRHNGTPKQLDAFGYTTCAPGAHPGRGAQRRHIHHGCALRLCQSPRTSMCLVGVQRTRVNNVNRLDWQLECGNRRDNAFASEALRVRPCQGLTLCICTEGDTGSGSRATTSHDTWTSLAAIPGRILRLSLWCVQWESIWWRRHHRHC